MDNNILTLVLVVAGAILLFWFFTNRTSYNNEGELTVNEAGEAGPVAEAGIPEASQETYRNTADGYLPNSSPMEVGQPTMEQMANPSICYPKDQLTPGELLPQDYSSTWAQCNPVGVGSLDGKNFLEAGHHIGINTVGQTLRNANLQLRSEPPNPQVVVSPFVQSTIEPDTNRRFLEMGNC